MSRKGKMNLASDLIKGKVVKIVSGSGAIERCPECGRALVNDHCPVHIDIEPEKDLRIKARLDSGELIVINGEEAEKMLGIKTKEAHLLPEYDVLKLIRGKIKDKEIKANISPINREEKIYGGKNIEILE